ncbi:MAG: YqeG family HAD IIIA-type phosphatase [Chloroflexi bacterium]|nr:YqeG family HAD IIIA-type phosphatase [Chloroflexota bacterium]
MPGFSEALPNRSEIRPDQQVDSIADIDARALYDRGIRAIAFDADQTLCRFHGMGIHERLLMNIEVMRGLFADRLCIISNCTDTRRQELIEHFPLYVVPVRKRKPSPLPYREAERHFDVPPEQWAFVGDRILTDIVGANRAGWHSILVPPLVPETDPWFIALMRSYERLLRRAYGM